MWKTYIKEQLPWVLFVFCLLLLVNLVILLDKSIALDFQSLLYIDLLCVGLMVVFLCGHYLFKRSFIQEIRYIQGNAKVDFKRLENNASSSMEREVVDGFMHMESHYNEQLQIQAKKTSERDDYIIGWIHEAKAPLTAMKLIIDQGRKENNNPQLLKDIEDEWLRLDGYVDEQLYSTRLLHFEKDYYVEEVKLSKCVHPILSYYSKWIIEKRISVELENLDYLVKTDKKWLRFIIKQIIDNAIKYSDVGGEISIKATNTSSGIQLEIKDSGCGIAKEHIPQVFARGYTGAAGRIHSSATGIGLYLVKDIATKLSHPISLTSVVDRETAVTILFSAVNKIDKLTRM